MKILKTHFRLIFSSALLFALVAGTTYLGEVQAIGITDLLQEQGQGIEVPAGVPGQSLASETKTPQQAVNTVALLMQRVADGLAALAAAVAILFVVINGARLTFSFGNTEELGKAKKGLIWATVGLLLIIFAYIIAKSVISLTYSGADGSSVAGTQMTQAEPEFTAANTISNPVPGSITQHRQCRLVVPPKSCYAGRTDGSQQTSTGDCNRNFDEVCKALGLEPRCSVSSIQAKLGALEPGQAQAGQNVDDPGSYYHGLGQKCSEQDNKYGLCTAKALGLFLKKACSASS